MQKIFQYDNATGQIELNIPEILLVREFAALMDNERNKCKEDKEGIHKLRAFKEFTYIWLAIDWQSVYADFSNQEKHEEALKDSGLTEEEYNNPEFRSACRKYQKLLDETRCIKMLQAAQNTVDKFIDYFNNIDPEERDVQTGKPIYKVKDIMTEISSLSKVQDELQVLESQVKKQMEDRSTIRGGAIDGYLPNF